MKKLKGILFDFDGVLSKGRFYNTIPDEKKEVKEAIRNKIFTKEAWPTIEKWMKGEYTYHEIHEMFAKEIGVTPEFLDRSLEESVKAMPLNIELLNFATEMRNKGVKTAVFTDNMDIFEEVLVPHYDLASKFDFILSSSSYGKLKLDDDAEFLQYAMKTLGVSKRNILFLDDSPKIGIPMTNLGGTFYLYEDYQYEFPKFIKWLNETYDIK